jgi:uncharacterized damage-inducible protein DinB
MVIAISTPLSSIAVCAVGGTENGGSMSSEMTISITPLRQHLQLMARYNLWASRRLLAAVDALDDEPYRRDVGLFFKSVHGTLNHLLVAEHLLWMPRFAEGKAPKNALNEEAESDRAQLRQRLLAGAQAWLPLLETWPEERLHGPFQFQRANGERVTTPFAATLLHVFNHGTHHRGQISAGLTALCQAAPEIDLMYLLREESAIA